MVVVNQTPGETNERATEKPSVIMFTRVHSYVGSVKLLYNAGITMRSTTRDKDDIKQPAVSADLGSKQYNKT